MYYLARFSFATVPAVNNLVHKRLIRIALLSMFAAIFCGATMSASQSAQATTFTSSQLNRSVSQVADPVSEGLTARLNSPHTFNETSRNGIARLNADGSLDTSFDPGRAWEMGGSRSFMSLSCRRRPYNPTVRSSSAENSAATTAHPVFVLRLPLKASSQ
jgi:Domain of unknown function (DUF5122) beta-propeller